MDRPLDRVDARLDELDRYVRGEHRAHLAAISRLERTLDEVLPVLVEHVRPDGTWPYELPNDAEPLTDNYSYSTNAMIMFALCVSAGLIVDGQLTPDSGACLSTECRERREKYSSAVDSLVKPSLEDWITRSEDLTTKGDTSKGTVSRSVTWGPDDPLTLTWIREVHRALRPHEWRVPEEAEGPQTTTFLDKLETVAAGRVEGVFANPRADALKLAGERRGHSFPLLRTLHLNGTLRQHRRVPTEVVDFVTERVHLQMSYDSIQDAPFDAAELVFALESVLLCDPTRMRRPALERAFDVLARSQERSAYWRPLQPISVSPQGRILLPQSVEIANSLLRVCQLVERVSPELDAFARLYDLFRRYHEWLESRKIIGPHEDEQTRYTGWQSEHTYAGDRVHLWETSQVTVFLEHYSARLRKHVAQVSRMVADLHVGPRASGVRVSQVDRAAGWDAWTKWEQSEPALGADDRSDRKIYSLIGANFIRPMLDGQPASYSMLLYGPPGTGKSTIAKKIAEVLGWELITITPSDFIRAGAEGVEARAKNVFRVLNEQQEAVILFDEIDRMILDRDSRRYERQSDIFQFMTPGMLTKLGDLRGLKSVIFIIATNYAERIDTAIKRPGRIDWSYLVLPPDRLQRVRLLGEFLSHRKSPYVEAWAGIGDRQRTELGRATSLMTYEELRRVVEDVPAVSSAKELFKELLAAVERHPPAISPGSYAVRLRKERDPSGSLRREAALVAHLELEAGKEPPRELAEQLDHLPALDAGVLSLLTEWKDRSAPPAAVDP